jgi:four helix bundle protein
MTFEEFEEQAPRYLTRDRTWKMRVYRLASFASHVVSADARRLYADPLTRNTALQLLDAVGSIRANIAEGYSRSSGKDRVRFFEYGLGSARESREWYSHGQFVLGESLVTERADVLDEIIRMLLWIIPPERGRSITTGD